MNPIRLFLSTLLLTVCFVHAANPDGGKARYLKDLLEKHLSVFNAAIHQAQSGMLAKRTGVKADTAMITHIDVSVWDTIANGWKNDGYFDLVYDGRGRNIELKGFAIFDSISFSIKQEFDPNGIRIRQTFSFAGKDSSLMDSFNGIAITDYYPGYNASVVPGLAMEDITLFPTIMVTTPLINLTASLDSCIQTQFLPSHSDAPPDTFGIQKTFCLHSSDTGVHVRTEFYDFTSGTDPKITEWETVIKGNPDRIDTVREIESTGKSFQTVYTYDQAGRMTGQTYEWQSGPSVNWTFITNSIFSYTADGRITSQINQDWNDDRNAWENSEKLIPTYSIVARSPVHTAPPQAADRSFRVAVRKGDMTISAPAGFSIEAVSGFDLHGRRIAGLPATLSLMSGETVTIPWKSGCRSMQLLRVQTNRGVVNLKVNGVATD